MSQDGNYLDLLLVHADDHAPVLERGLGWLDAAGAPEPPPRPQPSILWSDTADANDLASQRWGVIAPRGAEGDRLLELVAPLIERRRRQQGGRAVRIHRVPERMSLDEAVRWKKRAFRKGDDLDLDVPRYQLILGDLDQVPLAVQQVQATDGFVGRLAFDRADDYRAYVDKVLGWEDRPAPVAAGQAILHTVHDGTPATRRGHAALMLPGQQILERRRGFGEVRASALRLTGSDRPTPGELLAAAAAPGPESDGGGPGVLLSLSHGLGAPRAGWQAAERQRREQGALSFGGGRVLAGPDLAGRSFLPGGVWLAVACFGAGTTDTSDYYHWLDTLRRAGHVGSQIEHVLDTLAHERPFVAALPKAALASPEGPLAFIGHVDLAWAYSFFALDDRPTRRPGRFMGVLRSLLHGDRAGAAMRALSCFFDEVNTELTALYDEHARTGRPPLDDRARARRGHLWMLRQDLAGYVLLGDPAVRLPLGGAGRETTGETSAETGRATGAGAGLAGSDAGAGAGPDGSSGADIDSAEAAVRAVIGGMPVVVAASAHGLKRDQLERLVAIYEQAGRSAIERALGSCS
jgi:hypothetical protein